MWVRRNFDRENTGNLAANPTHTLKCLYTNLDGVRNKAAALEELLDRKKLDFVFLMETKCEKIY